MGEARAAAVISDLSKDFDQIAKMTKGMWYRDSTLQTKNFAVMSARLRRHLLLGCTALTAFVHLRRIEDVVGLARAANAAMGSWMKKEDLKMNSRVEHFTEAELAVISLGYLQGRAVEDVAREMKRSIQVIRTRYSICAGALLSAFKHDHLRSRPALVS